MGRRRMRRIWVVHHAFGGLETKVEPSEGGVDGLKDNGEVDRVRLQYAVVDVNPVPPRGACLGGYVGVVECKVHGLSHNETEDDVGFHVALH